VKLPFTPEQFFGVFADYNRASIAAAAALWLGSIVALAQVAGDPSRRSPRLSLFLGALWFWNGAVYHAVYFTRINPAAWLFAVLFLLQAGLFFWTATRRRIEYFASVGWRRAIGLGLIGYALLYPFLTMALGHRYPATPTFGVPCPTDILTIGVLLTSQGRVPIVLAIVPVVWGFVGGSAAILLSVPTDYALLFSGVLLTAVLVAERLRSPAV
jgi:hypothetical protein